MAWHGMACLLTLLSFRIRLLKYVKHRAKDAKDDPIKASEWSFWFSNWRFIHEKEGNVALWDWRLFPCSRPISHLHIARYALWALQITSRAFEVRLRGKIPKIRTNLPFKKSEKIRRTVSVMTKFWAELWPERTTALANNENKEEERKIKRKLFRRAEKQPRKKEE